MAGILVAEGRRYRIRGRVQGVFFRESTRARAVQLGLAGRALNLADGSVEVVVFGSGAALDELAEWLAQGPPAARVDQLDWVPHTELPEPEDFATGWH